VIADHAQHGAAGGHRVGFGDAEHATRLRKADAIGAGW